MFGLEVVALGGTHGTDLGADRQIPDPGHFGGHDSRRNGDDRETDEHDHRGYGNPFASPSTMYITEPKTTTMAIIVEKNTASLRPLARNARDIDWASAMN